MCAALPPAADVIENPTPSSTAKVATINLLSLESHPQPAGHMH